MGKIIFLLNWKINSVSKGKVTLLSDRIIKEVRFKSLQNAMKYSNFKIFGSKIEKNIFNYFLVTRRSFISQLGVC